MNLQDIKILRRAEHLNSKSGALILVYSLLEKNEFEEFLQGHEGLRNYFVRDIPKGAIGGKEFHTRSKEILYVLSGGIEWYLEDLGGNKRTLVLKEGDLVFYIPPLTLHQYKSTADNTSLLVQRNTQEIDTKYEEVFQALRQGIQSR